MPVTVAYASAATRRGSPLPQPTAHPSPIPRYEMPRSMSGCKWIAEVLGAPGIEPADLTDQPEEGGPTNRRGERPHRSPRRAGPAGRRLPPGPPRRSRRRAADAASPSTASTRSSFDSNQYSTVCLRTPDVAGDLVERDGIDAANAEQVDRRLDDALSRRPLHLAPLVLVPGSDDRSSRDPRHTLSAIALSTNW